MNKKINNKIKINNLNKNEKKLKTIIINNTNTIIYNLYFIKFI